MHSDGILVLSKLTVLTILLGIAGCFTSVPPAKDDSALSGSEVGSIPVVLDGPVVDNAVPSDNQADMMALVASQIDSSAEPPAPWDGGPTPVLDGPADVLRPDLNPDDTANPRLDSAASDGEMDVPQSSPPDVPVANDVARDVSATGAGGGTGTGGVVNTGGTMGSGGTTSTGGTASAGGVTGLGGTTISGGVTSSGGTTSTGGTTGNGGNNSTGGAAATGGTTISGGTTYTGGTTSTGGSPSTGGTIDVASIVPTLDGYMWVATCSDGAASGLDCPFFPVGSTACPNPSAIDFNSRGVFRTVTHTVGGTAGIRYTLNFEVRGVVGGRCYVNGTPAAAGLSADPETSNNGWYQGGTPTDSKWNTFEVHVSPAVTGSGAANPLNAAEDIYYMNAFPYPPITYGSDTYCEAHETFPMNYTASFPVMGGGQIALTIHDTNCLNQQNCGGPNRQTTCGSPRAIDLTGMSPPATWSYTQPYIQTNGSHPQWLYIDVKTVSSP